MRLRMELLARIRRDVRVDVLFIRGLAKRHQIGRDTVRQALSDPAPPARKSPVKSSRRLELTGALPEDGATKQAA
jgi:hypothetical protein